ncbi:MAG: ADP-ribosylglycohydrolase family protein, partial [Armatimonadota bacterium]
PVDSLRDVKDLLGRIAGCMLGKPVEGRSRTDINALLEHAGAYPLSDYFPPIDPVPEGHRYPRPDSPVLRGNIARGVRDDDTDYTLLGLHIIAEDGRDFTSADVGNQWMAHFPYHCVYTAERVAYRNLVAGLVPPDTARFRNPYREWIGAQIRADLWGYVNPGNPELAAEYAYRDASLSHVKNGIYGEMFFSALLAAGFAAHSLDEAIDAALSEVPANCRFAEAVRDVRAWADESEDWSVTWDKIRDKYGHYHGVHTINNAAVVIMGLSHSGGDFEKAICISVMAGLDTDCNGATAGSVMGLMLGAAQLPEKWIAPLNDRLQSALVGMTDCRISDLAERTVRLTQT